MAKYKIYGSLLVTNLLLPIGVIVFIVGFFRGKPSLLESVNTIETATKHDVPVPVLFDKVIFMMVDALRSDFVFSEGTGFQYTQKLIRSGKAIPFTARAASPTLTLSRIKALTRGTSQSFLDVWLNVFESENARSLAGVDTWLSRLKTEKSPNKKMVFYGADLWLDMYSDIFDRFEGTDAWYLPEFDSVDTNVTRQLPEELENDDWKALILHYLGLDNIAHQGGPQGPHMLVKQTEMDAVAKLIYEALEEKAHLQDTLFILLGDHGMTEQGNHGGGSTSEIASAMVFISPKFKSVSRILDSPLPVSPNYEYYSVINQIDLVPTLAGLMGFTTPSTSLGVFPADMLEVFPKPEDRIGAVSKNARQLKDLLDLEHGSAQFANASCDDAFEVGGVITTKHQVLCAFEAMTLAQQKLEAGDDVGIDEVLATARNFSNGAQKLLNIPPNNPSYKQLAMSVTTLSVVIFILVLTLQPPTQNIDGDTMIFGFAVTLHASSLFVNQFVTEEHRYWYWGSIAWLAYLGSRMANSKGWFSAVIYPAALQFLSQSLDPATNPQYSVISYVHNQLYGYQVLFWVPGLLIYASGLKSLSEYVGLSRFVYIVAGAALCVAAVFFRLSSSYRIDPEIFSMAPAWFEQLLANINRNLSLNIFWTGLVALLVLILLRSKFMGRLSPEATLIATTEVMNLYLRSITRSEYLVLFPIFDLQLRWLLSSVELLSPSTIAVTSLFLGQSAFYASGHGNSFASFDLTNGFNGIESSRTLAVALQALLSNYFGPVWWALASLRLLRASQQARAASKATQTNEQATTDVKITDQTALEPSNNKSKPRVKRVPATGTPVKGIKQVTSHGKSPFLEHMTLQSLYTAFSSMAVVSVCVWRRNDSTLWTVLTPKCLNVILWVCFEHLMINVILSTALWGIIVA